MLREATDPLEEVGQGVRGAAFLGEGRGQGRARGQIFPFDQRESQKGRPDPSSRDPSSRLTPALRRQSSPHPAAIALFAAFPGAIVTPIPAVVRLDFLSFDETAAGSKNRCR